MITRGCYTILLCTLLWSCVAADKQCEPEPELVKHRPCPQLDEGCIARHLASTGLCTLRQEPTCSFDAAYRVAVPAYNVSIDSKHIRHEYQHVKVTEFYVNPVTNVTVLSAYFSNVVVKSHNAIFWQLLPRREPKMLVTDLMEEYEYVETTTVFHSCDKPELCDSHSQAFISSLKGLNEGHGVNPVKICDPSWERLFNQFLHKNFDVDVQELFLRRGRVFASFFIQNYLCNYGLPYTYGLI